MADSIANRRDTPADRAEIALEAAWELESIAAMLLKHMSDDVENLALRSLVRRSKRLACLIMSAIDEVDSVDIPMLKDMFNDGEVAYV